MTRKSLWFGLGCKAVAWALILFSVEGCSAQRDTVIVPSCIPLTQVSAATQDGARDELSAHPEMVNTYAIVGDWISMRDDDRVCLAHRKNVEKTLSN